MEYVEQGATPGLDKGVEGETPTHDNSVRPTVPSVDSSLDSPEKVADASC